jgi:hypothetical protein
MGIDPIRGPRGRGQPLDGLTSQLGIRREFARRALPGLALDAGCHASRPVGMTRPDSA